jgi:hypothetical protein
MAEADAAGEILFLHACTPYESARTPTPRTVSGEAYDITALVSERGAPQHVQMVWHGVNDEWNLRQFLTSRVTWGECDLRVDPLGRLVLRHDSFEDTPWCAEERLLRPPSWWMRSASTTGHSSSVELLVWQAYSPGRLVDRSSKRTVLWRREHA